MNVPGYTLLLPKSWFAHNYARVVVYIKNTHVYERVQQELEDEQLLTIWIKTGLKNAKSGFHCHDYRENLLIFA